MGAGRTGPKRNSQDMAWEVGGIEGQRDGHRVVTKNLTVLEPLDGTRVAQCRNLNRLSWAYQVRCEKGIGVTIVTM